MGRLITQDNVTIVPYGDAFVEAHKEFCSIVWPGKKRRREEEYNRWKFRGPEKGDVYGLLLAISEGKVLGQLGLIPVKVTCKGEERNAQWACDLMVDPEYRKSGIGNKLFMNAFERDVVTLGNNPSPRAEALMLKAGFRKISSGRLMVFPLDASHILKWIIPEKLQFVTPAIAGILQIYFSHKSSKLVQRKSAFNECSLTEVSAIVAKQQQKSDAAQILHDKDFLHWRAAGFKHYSPELKCMNSDDGSYAIHCDFKPSYNIYDWSCKTLDVTADMISDIIARAGEMNCKIVQAIANSNEEEMWLSKLGFVRARNEENVIQYSRDGFLRNAGRFRFTLYDTDLNL